MTASAQIRLREARPVNGFGLAYACRTARAWWYSAWLRTLARFSRTYLGSFWLGLSNLLSVALLAVVYGAVFRVPNPWEYAVFLGLGITLWGLVSQAAIAGCGLFTTPARRDQLVNNTMPALFYCLEEWAFQLQSFAQAFLILLVAAAFLQPSIVPHFFLTAWLPLLNLGLFTMAVIQLMAILGARFRDVSQLMPIVLQLLFLISPILYRKESLGRVSLMADLNPFYRILEPLRHALITGRLHLPGQLIILLLNIAAIAMLTITLKRVRYLLPLWV